MAERDNGNGLDRVSKYFHIHLRFASQQPQTCFTSFSSSADPHSGNSGPQMKISNCGSTKLGKRPLKVSTRSRRHTETGSTITERKEKCCRKQPSTPRKTKKEDPLDSDEDDEEPQSELGTSSSSQSTVPVQPLHQGPAASSQGPAASSQGPGASANSCDEDSECSDD